MGEVRQAAWLTVAEEGAQFGSVPVRPFPVRRGKRLAPGWWWSSTTGRMVHYGNAAMRDRVMLLDQDPGVVDMACRPLEFVWREGERVVRHAPHLMARLSDGRRLMVDCLRGGESPPAPLLKRQAVVIGCAQAAGWEYRAEAAADPIVVANVRWLSGYRHPRCAGRIGRGRLREAFERPRPLWEGAAALGDVMATLPAVFHGLWAGVLSVPTQRLLGPRCLVSAVAEEGR
jgi:hypothetical protein